MKPDIRATLTGRTAQPDAELTVAELLAERREAAAVFVRRRMSCVGCTMSRFETLSEVAQAYGADLPAFLDELRAPIAGATRSGENTEERS